MKEFTPALVAKYIDHTLLKANAVSIDFDKLCEEAIEYQFISVMVNPAWIKYCKTKVENKGVKVGTVIGFPLGSNTKEVKLFEAEDAVKNGADELDFVINIGKLKDHDYNYIKQEMSEMASICRSLKVCSKIIIETCYLSQQEIKTVAEIASEVKPNFIKTSTGFGTDGAIAANVKLMKEYSGEVKVKASGGIRDLKTCLEMIEAGAERIGTSSGVAIIESLNKKK